MIGKNVTVIVDRPIGSYHPKFKDSIYKVNYGFIDGTINEEGKGIGAYILGVDKPVEKFEGVVIAKIERLDDVEDKYVVAPIGQSFNKIEIAFYTFNQEKFFKTKIITKEDE